MSNILEVMNIESSLFILKHSNITHKSTIVGIENRLMPCGRSR